MVIAGAAAVYGDSFRMVQCSCVWRFVSHGYGRGIRHRSRGRLAQGPHEGSGGKSGPQEEVSVTVRGVFGPPPFRRQGRCMAEPRQAPRDLFPLPLVDHSGLSCRSQVCRGVSRRIQKCSHVNGEVNSIISALNDLWVGGAPAPNSSRPAGVSLGQQMVQQHVRRSVLKLGAPPRDLTGSGALRALRVGGASEYSSALEPAFRSTLLSCPCHRARLCRLRWPISGALEDDMKSTNFLLISFDQRPWPIQPCGIVGCGSVLLIQSLLASAGQFCFFCAIFASCMRGRADPGDTCGDLRHVLCLLEERQAAHGRRRPPQTLPVPGAGVCDTLLGQHAVSRGARARRHPLLVAECGVSNCVYCWCCWDCRAGPRADAGALGAGLCPGKCSLDIRLS